MIRNGISSIYSAIRIIIWKAVLRTFLETGSVVQHGLLADEDMVFNLNLIPQAVAYALVLWNAFKSIQAVKRIHQADERTAVQEMWFSDR